jgi:hypothetical protein
MQRIHVTLGDNIFNEIYKVLGLIFIGLFILVATTKIDPNTDLTAGKKLTKVAEAQLNDKCKLQMWRFDYGPYALSHDNFQVTVCEDSATIK